MKQSAKPTTERPKAVDTLVGIVDLAITFRFPKDAIVVRCCTCGRRV